MSHICHVSQDIRDTESHLIRKSPCLVQKLLTVYYQCSFQLWRYFAEYKRTASNEERFKLSLTDWIRICNSLKLCISTQLLGCVFQPSADEAAEQTLSPYLLIRKAGPGLVFFIGNFLCAQKAAWTSRAFVSLQDNRQVGLFKDTHAQDFHSLFLTFYCIFLSLIETRHSTV